MPVHEDAQHDRRQEERRGGQRDVRAVRADGRRKFDGGYAPQAREPELAAVIDQLMRVGRHPLETIDDVRRIASRARQREMFAGAAVERGDPGARDRRRIGGSPAFPRDRAREERFELRPIVLVRPLEPERRHHRRPRTHCATPRTRRVTSGPERPLSPEAGAASAASSSSRSAVSRGARAANAMTAA